MAEPADSPPSGSLVEVAERVFLAGLGAVSVTRERAESLADDLVGRGKLTRDEARERVDGLTGSTRESAQRLGERASARLSGLFANLGLVTGREYKELELRVAQLELRVRLVERKTAEGMAPAPGQPEPQ